MGNAAYMTSTAFMLLVAPTLSRFFMNALMSVPFQVPSAFWTRVTSSAARAWRVASVSKSAYDCEYARHRCDFRVELDGGA